MRNAQTDCGSLSDGLKPKVVFVASHPIQYQAHWFRDLARIIDLQVLYAHRASPEDQSRAGFDTVFDWDVDLLTGYRSYFLRNIARKPSSGHFYGCDTPEIYEVLRRVAPDLVVICGWYLKSFWQAAIAAKRLGCVVAVRGDSHLGEPRAILKQYVKKLVYPLGLKTFDIAMFVGQRSRAYFRHYGVPDARLRFVPHSVDESFFLANATVEAGSQLRERHQIAEQDHVVAFAGKMIPRKRASDLLHMAVKLKQGGFPITILLAGAGPLEAILRAQAKEQDVKAIFLGFQNQSQMPSVYAAANVFALPSDNESWGLVANEALASGTPILISDAVGCGPDLAGDGRAGRLHACSDVEDMAIKLRHLILHPPSATDIAGIAQTYSTASATSNVVTLAEDARRRRDV